MGLLSKYHIKFGRQYGKDKDVQEFRIALVKILIGAVILAGLLVAIRPII